MERVEEGHEGIQSLSLDLLSNILARLPVRLLGQLMSVSKPWLALISDPDFKKLHRYRWMKCPKLLTVKEATRTDTLSVWGPLHRSLHLHTMDVSNKDVCGTVYTRGIKGRRYGGFQMFPSTNLVYYRNRGSEYVCNLATKEVSCLPCSSFRSRRGMVCGYILATNEYKIVSFFDRDVDADYTSKGYKLGCEILTLRDGGPVPGSWRQVEDLPQPYAVTCPTSAHVNGSMYIMFSHERILLSFELENEKFKSLGYPQDGYTRHREGNKVNMNMVLAELEGFLCLGYHWKQFSAMTIYMLVDLEREIWVKKYNIPLYEIGREIRILGLGYLPLTNENGEILMKLFRSRGALYNIENKSFRRVGDASIVCDDYNNAQFDLYFERFFSLGRR
ncbi:hypothetical protein RJ639_031247 [Escallonia herrerae]|uniref:F-box domain-containing protein n=1 Tax=Escallonia herrerae TaxID=1293975 RepID=A0AA88XDE2_9ASTE|nr:hypothetical protein RJ639_031247 [Escallonia herrerae]